MTDKITVPRETWDAMRGALKQIEWSNDSKWQADCARQTLTAANAVQPQAQVGVLPIEGSEAADNAIHSMLCEREWPSSSINAARAGWRAARLFAHPQATEPQAQGVSNPLGWYCVSRDGLATQCADQRDAELTAKSANRDWPNSAPYRAVQLCEFEAHPQATEPAEKEDPLQGAVDWLLQADGEFFAVATVQRTLRIGYNRAKRLADMARERAAGPEAKQ